MKESPPRCCLWQRVLNELEMKATQLRPIKRMVNLYVDAEFGVDRERNYPSLEGRSIVYLLSWNSYSITPGLDCHLLVCIPNLKIEMPLYRPLRFVMVNLCT